MDGAFWPVAGTRDYRVPSGASGRAIGATRSGGSRAHAGIDLFAKHKDTVVAICAGQIISFYYFYNGTFALFVNHGSFVINYGEVEPTSLAEFGLKTPKYKEQRTSMMAYTAELAKRYPVLGPSGSNVAAGQPIARVGKMIRSSMLHIEAYEVGTETNKVWKPFNSSPPSGLLNPTNMLKTLAANLRG